MRAPWIIYWFRKRSVAVKRTVGEVARQFQRTDMLLTGTYPGHLYEPLAREGRTALYGTFAEAVGAEYNYRFTSAGKVYKGRKGLKRYTREFVKHYVRSWGYDIRW